MAYTGNPPMPEWNALSSEDRCRITDDDMDDNIFYSYLHIREALIKREQRYLAATMAGVIVGYTHLPERLKPIVRVKMRREVIW